jgi:hypothetical protein
MSRFEDLRIVTTSVWGLKILVHATLTLLVYTDLNVWPLGHVHLVKSTTKEFQRNFLRRFEIRRLCKILRNGNVIPILEMYHLRECKEEDVSTATLWTGGTWGRTGRISWCDILRFWFIKGGKNEKRHFFPPLSKSPVRSDGLLSEIGEWTDNHHCTTVGPFKRVVFLSSRNKMSETHTLLRDQDFTNRRLFNTIWRRFKDNVFLWHEGAEDRRRGLKKSRY